MPVSLTELSCYCDQVLQPEGFQDYCPNGLQVEGRAEVGRLASGVTASQALIEAAIEFGADALLVHHGYFWKGESPRVIGMQRRRLGLLLNRDISLLAYHLPLDAHPEWGNNVQLGRRMGWRVEGVSETGPARGLLWHGRPEQPCAASALAAELSNRLGRDCLHVAGGPRLVRRLAWCTGGAQGYIREAVELGVDAYVSGEISEPTAHIARECGIHYFAAGHHATERYGAAALGEHLAARYDLEHRFFDIGNPA